MIEARFTPLKSEVTGPARSELLHRPAVIALMAAIAVLLVVGVVTATAGLIAGMIAAAVYLAFTVVWVPERAWRRYSAIATGDVVYRISEDGVQASASNSASETDWTVFAGVVHSGDIYVLKTKTNQRLMIPRRAFASPADEQAFLELATRKIGASA